MQVSIGLGDTECTELSDLSCNFVNVDSKVVIENSTLAILFTRNLEIVVSNVFFVFMYILYIILFITMNLSLWVNAPFIEPQSHFELNHFPWTITDH